MIILTITFLFLGNRKSMEDGGRLSREGAACSRDHPEFETGDSQPEQTGGTRSWIDNGTRTQVRKASQTM